MTPDGRQSGRDGDPGEPPPFLGSWGRLYLAVLGWLALLILLFWLFARTFTP